MSPIALQRLQALAAAGVAAFYMNAQEGQELVQAGLIQVDPTQLDPNDSSKARVTLTAAGQAALTQTSQVQSGPVPASSGPVIGEVRMGLPIPTATRRGGANNLKPRDSQYPFDELPDPINDPEGLQCGSFHIACTADNPEPWKKMASNVSAANKRSEVKVKDEAGNVVMETVPKKKLVKGEDGKPVKDADGKNQYTEEIVTQPKMQATKKFIARRVNKDDPDGEGVRVFRVPLDY